ncbi:MAG: ATPase, T2SS/T4P/T4SS family [Verrucomicrobiota bacterium]|nr:ATPase, T2SS/T4P/T4SS family [Verrucomicrobiota bacterium]
MDRYPALRSMHPALMPHFSSALLDRYSEFATEHSGNADLAQALLEDSCRLGASDIHIEPHRSGTRIRIRLDGVVRDICHLPTEIGKVLVNQFKALANLDPIIRFTPRDGHARFEHRKASVDLRLALAPVLDRETLTVRILDPLRLERSIHDLGFASAHITLLSQWINDINGLFVATGPTGSGKTTTLYALLHSLKLLNKVILSLEDPVEYQIDGVSQIQIDELHHFQFADGIKAVLRHDPDYMMVGEMRDAESAHTAVRAAIAGRVLLTTLHSRDCVGTISALRNWGLNDHEIAESLSVVLSQRLVRKLCSDCSERKSPERFQQEWFQSLDIDCPAHFWESKGCEKCHQLGVRGRTGVFELWRLQPEDCQAIIQHADEHRLRAWLNDRGHRFLFTEALELLTQGAISFEEFRRVVAGTLLTTTE